MKIKRFLLVFLAIFLFAFLASCEQEKQTFKIRFLQDDESTVLYEYNAEIGTKISYTGEIPTKESDSQYSYGFDGWDHELGLAIKDETFIAKYTKTVIQEPNPDPNEHSFDTPEIVGPKDDDSEDNEELSFIIYFGDENYQGWRA